jgi:TatD DNase family protein
VTLNLPAIDAHAHIETTVSARDLRGLEAVVFAVTREPSEWQAALNRRDELSLWGIGVHPALPRALAAFDAGQFASVVDRFCIVGEVGLDGKSPIPLHRQREVFDSILAVVAGSPRPVSIHSVGRQKDVLDALQRQPIPGAVLHWWRGSRSQTHEAVEMGCYFSLNGAEAVRPMVMGQIPRDRILTETDFPFSRRSDRSAVKPGATSTIERALAQAWSATAVEVRRQLWTNLRRLFTETGQIGHLPVGVQDRLSSLDHADVDAGPPQG